MKLHRLSKEIPVFLAKMRPFCYTVDSFISERQIFSISMYFQILYEEISEN